jgi:hypothetical protein
MLVLHFGETISVLADYICEPRFNLRYLFGAELRAIVLRGLCLRFNFPD